MRVTFSWGTTLYKKNLKYSPSLEQTTTLILERKRENSSCLRLFQFEEIRYVMYNPIVLYNKYFSCCRYVLYKSWKISWKISYPIFRVLSMQTGQPPRFVTASIIVVHFCPYILSNDVGMTLFIVVDNFPQRCNLCMLLISCILMTN